MPSAVPTLNGLSSCQWPLSFGELDLQPFPRILSVLMHNVHQGWLRPPSTPARPPGILHPCCVCRYIMHHVSVHWHVPVQYQWLHGTGYSCTLRCPGRVYFVLSSHLINRQTVGHLTVTNDLELREKPLRLGRCLRPRSTPSPVQGASVGFAMATHSTEGMALHKVIKSYIEVTKMGTFHSVSPSDMQTGFGPFLRDRFRVARKVISFRTTGSSSSSHPSPGSTCIEYPRNVLL